MIAVAVSEASQVAECRRSATSIADRAGLGQEASGRVALVATELATNMIKHGSGGTMLVGLSEEASGNGVDLIALDQGRGMTNVEACLRDGYSSAGTAGQGLGAVIRSANHVEIASWPTVGTAILAQIRAQGVDRRDGRPRPARPAPRWGAVSIAKPGEDVCGDAWTAAEQDGIVTLCVADGLGHGPEAADASVAAVRLFHRFSKHQVGTLLDYVHGGLRATRGAAVSIGRYIAGTGKVTFAGIGNVAGLLAERGELKRMVSMPGTAGYQVRKIQTFDYPFASGLMILHSDGLSTSWTLARYPGVDAFHPTLIAAILYRDFGRGRDDATVLVGKWTQTP